MPTEPTSANPADVRVRHAVRIGKNLYRTARTCTRCSRRCCPARLLLSTAVGPRGYSSMSAGTTPS